MLKVTSHSSASATPARPSTETSASPAPLMSLRVSRRPDQPSRLAASSSGAAARLSTTAPPSKTHIVESTSGATLKVSVPNTPQEDPPALEDVTPCMVPTPYLAADAHCHLQQLVGYGKIRYASLEAALAVEVSHAIRVNPLVPSYCWPNTWEDILQPRPREARYIALGWHPTQAALHSDALLDQFLALLVTPDVVALGEVGLDYNRISYMEEPHQTKAASSNRSCWKSCVGRQKPITSHWFSIVGMLVGRSPPPTIALTSYTASSTINGSSWSGPSISTASTMGWMWPSVGPSSSPRSTSTFLPCC